MFGNKKNSLPPRPKSPDIDEILQDLKNSANMDDITFKLLAYESNITDSTTTSDLNSINIAYEKTKIYFEVNEKMKILKKSINKNEQLLQSNMISMIELTEEIKKQAQAALVQ